MKHASEVSKERLLQDYDNLYNNTFWDYFWENVKINRQSLLETLGGAAYEKDSDLRVYQGGIRAFDALLTLPDELLKIIKGEPETAPGDEYE
jgi:hypothetical protein